MTRARRLAVVVSIRAGRVSRQGARGQGPLPKEAARGQGPVLKEAARGQGPVDSARSAIRFDSDWPEDERDLKIQKLVLDNMDVVHLQVRSIIICRVWGQQFEKRDLIAAGYLMLVRKAGEFDTSRGSSFKAFARKAVRGAMWELVRRRNWKEASHLSLTSPAAEGEPLFDVQDERQAPEELLRERRRRECADEALRTLSPRERALVERYYGDEKLGAIGRDFGISASRASEIHRQALAKMQQHFALRGRLAA